MLIFLIVLLSLSYLIQSLTLLMNLQGEPDIKLDTRMDFVLWLFCPFYIVWRIIVSMRNKFNSLPAQAEKRKSHWE